MPKLTTDQILGFIDGRLEQVKGVLDLGLSDSYDRGRLQAYQDVLNYIRKQVSDPV